MEGLAIVVAFALILGGYFAVSAVLRRIPAPSLRLPTGPIPDAWPGIVERNVSLARGLSSEERERLLRLVQIFLADKHFEGSGGLILTEEMKVTIAAEACLLLLHPRGPVLPDAPDGARVPPRIRSEVGRVARDGPGGTTPRPPDGRIVGRRRRRDLVGRRRPRRAQSG